MPEQSRNWDVIVSPWHLDEHIAGFPVPAMTTQVVRPLLSAGPVPARMNALHRAVADVVSSSDRPLVLSGDCPTARAVVAPMQRRHPDLAVVWLDAHGDFNTPVISSSGYIGGMAIAMLTGRTPDLFDDDLDLRAIPDDHVVLADARDLDPAERDALDDSGVHRIAVDPQLLDDRLDALGSVPIHVHLDIDVIDATALDGARFPSGAGPSVAVVEQCLAAACARNDVVSASFACAWLPERVADPAALVVISRLAGALGLELEWPT